MTIWTVAMRTQMNAKFGCYKNTIRVRSGRYFDLLDPQPDQFAIEDIAGALSKICRFGGQIERFYSVAEHCLHCSALAEAVPLACLLHDAAEAFTGDIVKPLKILLPEFAEIECRVENVIAAKYGVDFQQPEVGEIDRAMLIAERNALFSKDNVKWTGEDEVRKVNPSISCLSPHDAEILFMRRVRELGVESGS